jgi:LysW-gamma-L-lysine carboxypeptidase
VIDNPAASTIISAQEAESLLYHLVSINSPSAQEARASEYLVSWMTEHGFEAFVDEAGNAVGIRGQGAHEIVLLGHMDTVPGEIPIRIEGRNLYGRGTVDAKGALAAFVLAACQIEPPSGTRLIVIGATEEESATSRGARHVLSRYKPSACFIGEPSRWDRITLGYKGRLLVDWSWSGALAHSAGPVPTPAEQAVDYWSQIQDFTQTFNKNRERSFSKLDLSLRGINTENNGTHGSAQMHLGLRLPTDLKPEQAQRRLRAQSNGAKLSFYGGEQAYVGDKNTHLVRALMRAIRAQGGNPRFVLKTGTSDMNVVGPVWNCPIAAYGPGDSRLDHTPEEHVNLDEFHRSVAVLVGALIDLMH